MNKQTNLLETVDSVALSLIMDWVSKNLNPHQTLKITLDGVTLTQETSYIPNKYINHEWEGK